MSVADMNVPETCKVLVVGGGPAGSYAASALAREGIDTVLLESDTFPRYHVGESMLPSMRHFLRFIDLDQKFDSYGFREKNGAAFRLNRAQPPAYTNFLEVNGPKGYSWNIVRSEADDLIFRHAGASGARIFDATKVNSVQFEEPHDPKDGIAEGAELPNPGRPVSATWSRKDGSSGSVKFDYLIDASGRNGVVSTKYFKNRRYNQGLKNIANWGYWKNVKPYGVGTSKAGAPYFESIKDASGWAWCIPLHNGTVSLGIVMNQDIATKKKREMGLDSKGLYYKTLDLLDGIQDLLSEAELVTDIKSASDWSYSASAYASPHIRIAGDAGCFIDPFFSSGVHLAMTSGLSAATTISASIRGDVDEHFAAQWHSKKVAETYTRFLIVVLSAQKQIRSSNILVLNQSEDENFDKAFDFFRPIIQGTTDADVKGSLKQSEISKSIDFCFRAFTHIPEKEKTALFEKLKVLGLDEQGNPSGDMNNEKTQAALAELEKTLSPNELQIIDTMRASSALASDGGMDKEDVDTGMDVIDGMTQNMVRGHLTLVESSKMMNGSAPGAMATGLNGEINGEKLGTIDASMRNLLRVEL